MVSIKRTIPIFYLNLIPIFWTSLGYTKRRFGSESPMEFLKRPYTLGVEQQVVQLKRCLSICICFLSLRSKSILRSDFRYTLPIQGKDGINSLAYKTGDTLVSNTITNYVTLMMVRSGYAVSDYEPIAEITAADP